MKASSLVVFSCAVLGSLVACSSDEKPLTEIVLTVDSNLAVPQQVEDVEITVIGASGASQKAVAPLTGPTAIKLPLTLSLTSEAGNAVVSVRVVGRFGGEAVITREVKTQFVEGESRLLGMPLVRACIPVTCPGGQTCGSDGNCAPIETPVDKLPPFTGKLTDPLLPEPSGGRVAALGPGETHTCVRTTTDRVLCWGGNETFELGNTNKVPRTAPRLVADLEGIEDVVSSVDFSCARSEQGAVFCWGSNEDGQLGNGTVGESVAKPGKVEGLPFIAQLATGEGHACALDRDGALYCWGHNHHGQLGDGTTTDRAAPVRVLLAGPASQVSVGEDHTCALLTSGEVQCWGANEFGALGNGIMDGADNPTPQKVKGITDAKDIRAGAYHVCAVRNQRVVSCWGRNNRGQLGDNHASGDVAFAAVPVMGLSDTKSIVSGEYHSCARSESGTVNCWGGNDFGQLGNGTTTDSPLPIRAQLSGSVDELASGMFHVCARKALDVVLCWGQNKDGQLGDGTTDDRAVPTPVIGLP